MKTTKKLEMLIDLEQNRIEELIVERDQIFVVTEKARFRRETLSPKKIKDLDERTRNINKELTNMIFHNMIL